MPCSVEGCQRGIANRGKCQRHLDEARKANPNVRGIEMRNASWPMDKVMDAGQRRAVELAEYRRQRWGW